MKARWRRGWACWRQERGFFINLGGLLGGRLLLNDASVQGLGSVGVLVVLVNRFAAASHDERGGRKRAGMGEKHNAYTTSTLRALAEPKWQCKGRTDGASALTITLGL